MNSKLHTSSESSIFIEMKAEIDRLRATVAEQTAEISRLGQLAETDPLTGLANRRAFDKHLQQRMAQHQRDGQRFCLMIVDIDQFKSINDQFGHLMGDRLLQQIAGVLTRNVRQADIVFRVGGDEFAIILPATDSAQATHLAKRIVEQVVKNTRDEFDSLSIGLSIGLADSNTEWTKDQLVELTDKAMFQSKRHGGNQYHIVARK